MRRMDRGRRSIASHKHRYLSFRNPLRPVVDGDHAVFEYDSPAYPILLADYWTTLWIMQSRLSLCFTRNQILAEPLPCLIQL